MIADHRLYNVESLAPLCLYALLRPQCLFDFYEILHSVSGFRKRGRVWGKNPLTPSHILFRVFAPVMHMESCNITVRRPEDIVAVNGS